MKRGLLLGSILLLLLFALLSWGLYFLLWTPGGVHWLLGKVEQYSNVKIQVARLSGRLAGDLALEGLQVRWDGGRLDTERLQISLDPLHLLRGKIHLRKLVVRGITWEEQETPPQPVDLTLPRLPHWLGRFDLEIEALHLEAFRYLYNQDPPFDIPGLSGRLAWKQGTLAVNPLKLDLASGRLEGAVGLGLWVPALQLEALFTPAAPLAGIDHLTLQARLKQGRSPVQMAGPLTVTGRAGSAERLVFQAQTTVGPHRIDLTRASLRAPGRKGTATGRGAIIFVAEGTRYRADLQLAEADLSPELKLPVRLSGDFLFEGTPSDYSGRFDLKDSPSSWRNFRLAGAYHGDGSGMEVALERGDWLKGAIDGRVVLGWDGDFSLRGSLTGRGLRPEVFDPRWPGLVNLDLQGSLLWPGEGRPQGVLNLRLLDSQFQQRSLKGLLLADWQGGRLTVQKAELQGRGFTLAADGVLDERLNFEARIANLTPLVPDGRGSGSARGWVRWRDKKWGGQVVGQGRSLIWKQVRAGSLDLSAGFDQEKRDTTVDLQARIRKGAYADIPVDSLALRIGGTLIRQELQLALEAPQGRIQGTLQGGYAQKVWRGTLVTLTGAVPAGRPFRLLSPAELIVGPDRLRISPLVVTGEGEERLTLEADVGFEPLSGLMTLSAQRLNADRARSWLASWKPEGRVDGRLQARFSAGDLQEVRVRADLQGQFRTGRQTVAVQRAGGQLDWDGGGLRSSWEIKLGGGETWTGRADSTEKPRLAVPAQGTFRSSLQDFHLETWNTAFPAGLLVRGKAGGRLQGRWSAGSQWDLNGDLQVEEGSLSWKGDGADLQARLNRAELGFLWQGETLRGRLVLELEKYGQAAGEFSLPLPARLPLRMQPAGAVNAAFSGRMRVNGLAATLFPQAARASRGNLQWDLAARGTWEKPIPSGNFELSEAGVDLPTLGIRLEDVSLKGGFREDRLQIDSLILRSGPGTLNGSATLLLQDRRIAALQGRLTGKNFQFVNRPGLRALGNPELEFTGPPERIRLSGKVEIPEALISGGSVQGVKKASPDVVIKDAPQARPPERSWPLQGEVALVFGEKVRLQAEGLNTLLKGQVRVALLNSRDLRAEGEIRADQGYYLVQGSRLEITRGRLIFKGPPDNPTLDLLALRTVKGSQRLEERVDEVRAGVAVTGTVRSPLVRLYSQPAMTESDILSYILFGKPMGRGEDRTDLALLGKAARSLLGKKTEDTLLSRLELDSLDIQTGGGDMSRSMVTVGKYLDPNLYLGLGGSLFSNTYQVILRYSLTPRLELETKGGTQSGGGIFFKVDFE
ncbi:MAG: translocation/assembly module TamB domain-containing protein [Deltaproteobacteria bacterium]|nr:translocation/assembly module TamB domain-containing protein [Deltaproteobacteria bacterium]